MWTGPVHRRPTNKPLCARHTPFSRVAFIKKVSRIDLADPADLLLDWQTFLCVIYVVRAIWVSSEKEYTRTLFFFFHSTAQLQYVEDSEPVTRSMWPLMNCMNSAKTELQVQK